jgi:hypothetical protein
MDTFTLSNLENNNLYYNYPQMMNDPFELVYEFADYSRKDAICFIRKFAPNIYISKSYSKARIASIIEEVRNIVWSTAKCNIRFSCFSGTNASPLMWAHYANKHEGICVEYNSDDLLFRDIVAVQYCDEPPRVDIQKALNANVGSDRDTYIRDTICSKSSLWEYEKEYRLFATQEVYDNGGVYTYNSRLIKSITFGLNCPASYIDRIKYMMKGTGVMFYRMSINTSNYGLNFSHY